MARIKRRFYVGKVCICENKFRGVNEIEKIYQKRTTNQFGLLFFDHDFRIVSPAFLGKHLLCESKESFNTNFNTYTCIETWKTEDRKFSFEIAILKG